MANKSSRPTAVLVLPHTNSGGEELHASLQRLQRLFRQRFQPHPPQHLFISPNLEHAYAKACPVKTAAPRPLLILGASMDSKLGLRDVNQTWMPERHTFFGMAQVNGYYVLAIVLFVSFVFQSSFFYFCYQANPLEKFRHPCILR
jgi:hypothetical protein